MTRFDKSDLQDYPYFWLNSYVANGDWIQLVYCKARYTHAHDSQYDIANRYVAMYMYAATCNYK